MIPARVAYGSCLLGLVFGWLIGLGASWVFVLVLPFCLWGFIKANRVS